MLTNDNQKKESEAIKQLFPDKELERRQQELLAAMQRVFTPVAEVTAGKHNG